jgi:hypothetical protein
MAALIPKIEPHVPSARPAIDTRRAQVGSNEERQTIHVTIGRVDVRLVSSEAPKRPTAPKQEAKPTLALEDYLLRTGERS